MTDSPKSKLTRDILLVGVGAFLSIAFQGLNGFLNAIFFPSLLFQKDASLGSYETAEFLLFIGGVILAIVFVTTASNLAEGASDGS